MIANLQRPGLTFLVVLVSTLCCTMALAATYQVSTVEEFQTALTKVEDKDQIIIAPGSYSLVLPYGIRKGISMRGSTGDPADVILDLSGMGDGFITAFDTGQLSELENLTLQGFSNARTMIWSHQVNIFNCVLENLQGGGSITGLIGTTGMTMSRTTVRNNQISGDCFLDAFVGHFLLEDCLFQDNTYSNSHFGTVSMTEGSLTMNRCTFTNETSEFFGSIYLINSTAEINDCQIHNNTSPYGPQIRVAESSQLVMTQTRVTGNPGGYAGSVITVLSGSEATFSHCEMQDNEGPLWLGGHVAEGCSALFHCCDMELSEWDLQGIVEFDYEGCGVSTTAQTFDSLKALYR